MPEQHATVLDLDYTSPRGEGETYAYFKNEDGTAVTLDWDTFEELGEPVQVTVSLVAGAHLAARSYSSA